MSESKSVCLVIYINCTVTQVKIYIESKSLPLPPEGLVQAHLPQNPLEQVL